MGFRVGFYGGFGECEDWKVREMDEESEYITARVSYVRC